MNSTKGYLRVSESATRDCRQISFKSDWFIGGEYYSIDEYDDYMVVTKHYIDMPSTALKSKKGYFQCKSVAPLGRFEIDQEESTEDEIIIYYEN